MLRVSAFNCHIQTFGQQDLQNHDLLLGTLSVVSLPFWNKARQTTEKTRK